MRGTIIVMACVLVGHTAAPAVAAEPEGEPAGPGQGEEGDRPWAKGVSQEDQDAAFKLFSEGTQLLKDAFFTRAVALYKKALELWDHPAIHFNLAKAMMNLDQPVDAYKHLEASLKFEGKPLEQEQIDQVKRYRQILYETELAEVIVTCTEPDAVVTLNGNQLFKAPGKWQGVVRPGNVTILAQKPGFQTTQAKPELKVGQKNDLPLELTPLDRSVAYTRPFSQAIPWTVLGTGVAFLAGGGIANWQASSAYTEYDDAVEACNAEAIIRDELGNDTRGRSCLPSENPDLQDKKDTGELMETLSLVGYIAGGVTVATGIVLFWVNRERPVVTEEAVTPVSVVPFVGPEGAGISATVGF
ncbi:MAG: tetratricopeptide repeat protein [Deltaproteobacteria bacterium]|nr:tetratricopeptide repeat protein [Deltaproteobacteria bacterium]